MRYFGNVVSIPGISISSFERSACFGKRSTKPREPVLLGQFGVVSWIVLVESFIPETELLNAFGVVTRQPWDLTPLAKLFSSACYFRAAMITFQPTLRRRP